MILDSLFVQLGFRVDNEQLEVFNQQAAELRETVGTWGAMFTAAAAGLGLFVKQQADALDELGDWAAIENIAINTVQELGYAAQLSGSSVEAMMSSMSGVNKVLGEAALGIGRGAMTFEKLGLSARAADGSVKSVDDVLAEVADRMTDLSQQEAIALAEKLGIDKSLIPMLRNGSEEIQKLRDEALAFGIASEADIEAAGGLNDALDRTYYVLGALSKTVAVALMPRMTDMINGFREWVLEHKKVIKSGLGGVLDVLSRVMWRVWSVVRALVGGLVDAVLWLTKFEVVTYAATAALLLFAGAKTYNAILVITQGLRGMVAGLMAVNGAAMLIPAAIGLVVLAVAALIEDFMIWQEGGKSVIGDLIERFPVMAGVMREVVRAGALVIDFFNGLWDTISGPLAETGQALRGLGAILLTMLGPAVQVVFAILAWAIPRVLVLVLTVIAGLVQAITYMLTFIVTVVTGFVNLVTAVLHGLVNGFTVTFANIRDGWDAMLALFTGDFERAGDKILAIWDRVVGLWTKGFDSIRDGIGWVSDKLGLSSTVTVEGKAPPVVNRVAQAVAAAPAYQPTLADPSRQPAREFGPMAQYGPGLLGKAEGGATSTTNTVHQQFSINAPIEVRSTDPVAAGREARDQLTQVTRQAIRNGESSVAL